METIALFSFWIVLSQKFDLFHLSMGLVAAIVIGQVSRRLFCLPFRFKIGPPLSNFQSLPWLKLLAYIPWLLWQIILANLHVARIVLDPKLPIHPQIIRFETKLPHALAQLVLANSITLTPGTVTINIEGDDFLVHSLTDLSAQQLLPDGAQGVMQNKVKLMFGV